MRPDMGAAAFVLFFIAVIAVTAFFTIRGIIRYAKRREAQRREMLELLRTQSGEVTRP